MQLDGWRSCLPQTRLNNMTGGLASLLDQLELRLGIAHPEVSYVNRVAHYRDALAADGSNHSRFYAASMSKNALATAETLLRWRDELVMGGWNGQSSPSFSSRLNDLAALESAACQEVKSGDGDRVRRINELLDDGANINIDLHVMDARDSLPSRLVQLFDKLGARFEQAELSPHAKEDTNLRRAQDALLGKSEQIQWNLNGDDSLLVCTAFSEMTLAQVAAKWMSERSVSRAVLATSSLSALSSAVRGLDQPVPGWNAVSAERPILQFLRLALRLRWQPLDPQHLLEFLVHPVSPLPSGLRHRLAAAVADRPGIGNTEWNSVVQQAQESARSRDVVNGSKDELNISARLTEWILIDRFDPIVGATGSSLNDTCRLVKDWALRRGAVENCTAKTSLWLKLASVAGEIGQIVHKRSSVPLHELEHLLALAEGQGGSRDMAMAELGCAPVLQNPAAALEPLDEIFWWFAEKPPALPASSWTRSELEALAGQGVNLVSAEAIIHSRHRASMLALLAAKERVRLFLPRIRAGEQVEHHPLLDELRMLADNKPPPELNVDAAVASGSVMGGLSAYARKPLPTLRRWWKLSQPALLQARAQESFSSLNLLVQQPFAWVLKYGAKLKEGPVGSFSVIADSRQRGNLLHRVTELLFSKSCKIDWKVVPEKEFAEWIDSSWMVLLETEGANLKLPGVGSDAERFRQQCLRVIWQLIKHLRAAGVVEAEADILIEGAPFRQNSTVNGRIDLLVRREGLPSAAVIDLKLGGKDKRRRELAQNTALQLAVYGYLMASANGGNWPHAAFFILSDGTMLAPQADGFFPNATAVEVKNVVTGAQACWNDFLRVWDWRRAQLDQGLIEVPVDGTALEATDPSPPDPRWAPDPEAARYDGYEALTGWRTDA
ncbi:MAG: PD-(D/E)XK nuclease family protein [Verrucomicrobiaceae bacterium]